jgi:ketosteroid isomerase-like protein
MLLAALFAIGCGGQPHAGAGVEDAPFDLQATRELIAQQNKQFTQAHISGDVAAIDAMFLSDSRSYPPGAAAAIGLPAIHALTVDFLAAGITEFREESTAFSGDAEHVIDECVYVLRYGAGVTERGKYLNVWKRVNGNWRIQSNIWNTDPPVSTPE